MNGRETEQMVNTLEHLSREIKAEVNRGEQVDWEKVNRYMEQREETVIAMGKIESLSLNEQKRVRKLLEEDRKTIMKIEEMKDKVAAQMRRMGNEEAGKVLDTRG